MPSALATRARKRPQDRGAKPHVSTHVQTKIPAARAHLPARCDALAKRGQLDGEN